MQGVIDAEPADEVCLVKWSKMNLFKNSYYLLIRLLKHKNILNEKTLKNLFIGCSMIKNVRGIDSIGSNHYLLRKISALWATYDRYRNATKVSIIVTQTGIPLGLKIDSARCLRHWPDPYGSWQINLII